MPACRRVGVQQDRQGRGHAGEETAGRDTDTQEGRHGREHAGGHAGRRAGRDASCRPAGGEANTQAGIQVKYEKPPMTYKKIKRNKNGGSHTF